MVDGSWASTAQFSGYGWVGKFSTYGDTKLYSSRVCLTFGDGSTKMGDGEYAPAFELSKFWNRLQGFDCNDQ